MKVIFLDIDGVLNNQSLLREFGIDIIGDELISLLRGVVFATAADIVLSSTWRISESNRRMVRVALGRHGMDIFDCTKEIRGKFSQSVPRSEEIKEWLSRFPQVTHFAILDDDSDAGLNDLAPHFFQTEFEVGLTGEIAAKVIEHLKGA